jgi:hypothetical protein
MNMNQQKTARQAILPKLLFLFFTLSIIGICASAAAMFVGLPIFIGLTLVVIFTIIAVLLFRGIIKKK